MYNSGDGSYRLFSSLRARDVGWSIIDIAFSPDKEHYVYSTWSSSLHLCSVNGNTEHQEPLSLVHTGRRFCWDGMVGRWYYVDKESSDEKEDWDLDKMMSYKSSQPLRRSLRLALKKRQEAT
ncbi:hypothetical protein NQ318_004290 [Aromia moschata]|uniref:Uncharacterized protein n=1 Tax=Aromia moschata TaxID=1265417 RepID=A0AAV8YT02_9CUCU|nr:hypothetical protein NQ318_004290 [Aromia moschata]